MQHVMQGVTGYPKTTILIFLLITAAFFLQMKHVRTETNVDAFFPKNHPAILYHYKVEDIFGVRSPMVLGVVDEGPEGNGTSLGCPPNCQALFRLGARFHQQGMRLGSAFDRSRLHSIKTVANPMGCHRDEQSLKQRGHHGPLS